MQILYEKSGIFSFALKSFYVQKKLRMCQKKKTFKENPVSYIGKKKNRMSSNKDLNFLLESCLRRKKKYDNSNKTQELQILQLVTKIR